MKQQVPWPGKNMDKIRILLADDHPILREGLRAVLETQPDFEVIAEAVNGLEAMQLSLSLQPDILLLDLEMPLPTAFKTILRLPNNKPKFGIIVSPPLDNINVTYTPSQPAPTAN